MGLSSKKCKNLQSCVRNHPSGQIHGGNHRIWRIQSRNFSFRTPKQISAFIQKIKWRSQKKM